MSGISGHEIRVNAARRPFDPETLAGADFTIVTAELVSYLEWLSQSDSRPSLLP